MPDSRPSLWGLESPFFAPLWRRVVIVVITGGWAVVEFVSGSPFWGVLFVGMFVTCAWQFFVVQDYGANRDDPGDGEE